MQFNRTNFYDIILIKPKIIKDKRGYFYESLKINLLNKFTKKPFNIVQENVSLSKKNVFRGLHFQKNPFPQAKLVEVIQGEIIDIVVDIRKNSINYKKHLKVNLSEKNKLKLFVPEGYAHGFYVKSKTAIVKYKVNNYYSQKHDSGISPFDKDLKISNFLKKNKYTISDKDKNLDNLKDLHLNY